MRKLVLTIMLSVIVLAVEAKSFAPPTRSHRPAPMHHALLPPSPSHHHVHQSFLPTLVGSAIGSMIGSTLVTKPSVIVHQPPAPIPVVVTPPSPVVATPVVMQKTQVWIPGRYEDVLVNGILVKVWQPGHYEWR